MHLVSFTYLPTCMYMLKKCCPKIRPRLDRSYKKQDIQKWHTVSTFVGGVLMNSAESSTTVFFVLLPSMAIWLKMSCAWTKWAVFPAALLWQFTQLERRLHYQKVSLWSRFLRFDSFSGAGMLLSCKRKAELQQKCLIFRQRIAPCKCGL